MIRLFFLIAICLTLLGCNRHNTTNDNVIFIQNNDLLIYVNYSEPEEYSFPFFHYPTVTNFSLDAKKQENKIPITGNDSLLVRKTLEKFEYLYYKDFAEDYYKKYLIDTITKKDFFFCGKISVANEIYFNSAGLLLTDSVNSFLVLTEQPAENMHLYDIESAYRKLYLLNFKNNKLTSIVVISKFLGDINNIYYGRSSIVNYFIDKHFSQIDYSLLGPPRTAEEVSFPIQEISDIVKFNENSKFISVYLSSYRIDENGFVEPNSY